MAAEKKKEKEYKLDIRRVLENLDRGNRKFYESLTDEEKKAFAPFVLMRWASSISGSRDLQEHYLVHVNELVNVNYSALNKHPELQWLLFSLIGIGSKQYHPWVPMPKKMKSAGTLVSLLLETAYPNANRDELEIMRRQNTDEDLIEHALSLAWSDKDIKDLKAELKKINGS